MSQILEVREDFFSHAVKKHLSYPKNPRSIIFDMSAKLEINQISMKLIQALILCQNIHSKFIFLELAQIPHCPSKQQ